VISVKIKLSKISGIWSRHTCNSKLKINMDSIILHKKMKKLSNLVQKSTLPY
jgi:hypothetical protein